jgi:predicted ATPase
LAHAIHQRTDGHPLFMVAVVDALVQQGRLVEHHGRWVLQGEIEPMTLVVPESLQRLVEQQFFQLGLDDQRVLEASSVAGVQFSAAAVAAGLEERDEVVEARCSKMAQRGQFLQSDGVEEWPDGTTVSGFRFRHTLYQQVVYDRLPVGRRIALHARVGERLEAGYRELATEHTVELATHFEQGRRFSSAQHYLRLAAEKALQRHAYQEAIGLLRRCLAMLPRLQEASEASKWELDVSIALGQALTIAQGPGAPAVAEIYARARQLCSQVGDIPQHIAVLRGLRRAAQGRGEPRAAEPLAEEFLRAAEQAQDATLLIEGHVALGVCLFYLGQLPTAHARLQEALAISDTHPTQTYFFPAGQDLRVLGLTYGAMVLWLLGYPEQALAQSRRAIQVAEQTGRPWDLAMALGYAALVHVLRGDRQAALERAAAAMQVATGQGVSPWAGRSLMLRGWALIEQGEDTAGLALMQQGLTSWEATGQELGKTFWLGLLGGQYAKAGRVVEGLQVIDAALALVQTREMRLWEPELHRVRGELILQQAASKAERASAEVCLRQAFEIACSQQAISLQLRAALSLSRLWRLQGQQQAARQCLEESYRGFTEGFGTTDLLEAKSVLEQLAGGK